MSDLTPMLTVEEYLTRTYYDVPYVMNPTFKASHMDAHFDANTGRWFTGGGAMDTDDSFSDTDDEAFSPGLLYRNEFPEVVLKIGRSSKKTQGRAKNKGLTFNPEIVHWILRGEHAQYADTKAWCIRYLNSLRYVGSKELGPNGPKNGPRRRRFFSARHPRHTETVLEVYCASPHDRASGEAPEGRAQCGSHMVLSKHGPGSS